MNQAKPPTRPFDRPECRSMSLEGVVRLAECMRAIETLFGIFASPVKAYIDREHEGSLIVFLPEGRDEPAGLPALVFCHFQVLTGEIRRSRDEAYPAHLGRPYVRLPLRDHL